MRSLATIFFVLFSLASSGQRLAILSTKNLGGDKGVGGFSRSIVYTADSGFIANLGTDSRNSNFNLGNCQTATNAAIAIFQKYRSDGLSMEWQKCYLDSFFRVYNLLPMSGGCFLQQGVYDSLGTRWVIRKELPNGSLAWTKDYGGIPNTGGVYLYDIIATKDGGFLLGGSSNTNTGDVGSHYGASMSDDIWLLKVDSNGNKQWSKVIGGSNMDGLGSLANGPNNSYYLGGVTISQDFDCTGIHNPNSGKTDIYVARIDSVGNLMWHRCLGGSDGEGFGNMVVDYKGGMVIAGTTKSSDGDVHNFKGGSDYWIVSLDSNGSISWDNCFGSPGEYEIAYGICRATNGDYWAIGESHGQGGQVDTGYGDYDTWVVRIDQGGTFKGQRVIGNEQDVIPSCIVTLKSGIVAALGGYNKGGGMLPPLYMPRIAAGYFDAYLIRIAPWPVGVDNVSENQPTAMRITPNPAKDFLHVSVNDDNMKDGTVSITDLTGRVLYHSPIYGNDISISVQRFSDGVYTIKYQNKEGRQETQKIYILPK